jgi:hypothetical protein
MLLIVPTERRPRRLSQYAFRSSLCRLRLGCFEGVVVSIDPFVRGRLRRFIRGSHGCILRQGIPNLRLGRGVSFDVARRFGEVIDVLFIDADRSYDCDQQRLDRVVAKVRMGGLIALDD